MCRGKKIISKAIENSKCKDRWVPYKAGMRELGGQAATTNGTTKHRKSEETKGTLEYIKGFNNNSCF